MTEEMRKALKHDMVIAKAKFLLTQNFESVKHDIEILAETGLTVPMMIYCASETIAENEIIDKIIETYPEMTSDEILEATTSGTCSRDHITKAEIRLSRKFKGSGSKHTDSENMLIFLKKASALLNNVSTEEILNLFERVVQDPENFSDGSVIAGFSALLKRNITPPFSAYEALLGVASQPFSNYYHNQVEARNIYYNRTNNLSEAE